MPHMMPMMWISIYLFTLLFMMITTSLFYFFYVPTPKSSKFKKSKKFHKWIWLW